VKKFFKLFGAMRSIAIIALVVAIGFSMAACDDRGNTIFPLYAVWLSSWGRKITITGSTGVFSGFENNPGALIQDAISKGYYVPGGQALRNITSTGNFTWSGQHLGVTYYTSSPNVATGTYWGNCTFSLSADGETLTFTDSSGGTSTWTRTLSD
jgi:hypothetical protein